MGEILLASEEADERSAVFRHVIADCPAQHRIAGLQCVEHRSHRKWAGDIQRDFAVRSREGSQMCREHDSYHFISVSWFVENRVEH